MHSNLEYSLEYFKILDNLQSPTFTNYNNFDRIDYSFKYEFYLNDTSQIIFAIEVGIQLTNELGEHLIDSSAKTCYLLIYGEDLVHAEFDNFLPIINDTFKLLHNSLHDKLYAINLDSLDLPELSMYETEFIHFKNEFLKLYFPSQH